MTGLGRASWYGSGVAFLAMGISVSSPHSVEDVQARLASATADWDGDFSGRAISPPPWGGDRFTACQGRASFWFSVPLVVEGKVEATDAGTILRASIRPHRAHFAKLLFAGLLLGLFGWVRSRSVLPVLFFTGFFGLGAAVLARFSLAAKSPGIEDLLVRACGGERAATSS